MTSTSRPIWATRASTDVEGQLVAEAGDEGHPGLFPVEVAGEVEEVGLDQQRAVAPVEGGAPAHRDGRLPARAVGPLVPPGVDAGRRQADAGGHVDVGGREPQLGAAPAIAVDHLAPGPDGAGPAGPPPPRPCPSATRLRMRVDEMGSSPARPSHRRSEQGDTPSTAKPAAAPISPSRATLPLRPWPKWKSSPTTTSRASSASTRIRGHEVLGRLVGPLGVEGDHHRAVHAGRLQQLQLLVEVAEQAGGGLGTDHRGRMAVEGDHRGGQAVGAAAVGQLGRAGPGGRGGRRRRPRWSPPIPRRAGGRADEVGHDVHHRGRLPPPPVRRPGAAPGRPGPCRLIRPTPGPRPGGSGRSRWPRTRPAAGGPGRPGPRDRPRSPRGAPGRAARPRATCRCTSAVHHHLVEVPEGLGRGEHHRRGQLVDQPGVLHRERPDRWCVGGCGGGPRRPGPCPRSAASTRT